MKSLDLQKIIRGIAICICAAVMLISGIKLCQLLLEYHTASSAYESTAEIAIVEAPVLSASDAPDNAFVAPFAVDFELLRQTNEDVIGWIYCDGTIINYPIMQGDQTYYYLEHLFDGSYNKSGSITLDSRCDTDFADNHTLIYGHNMKNGSMFASLKKYSSQQYYDEHPVMWIFTPEEAYVLELVAGYVTSAEASRDFDLSLSGDELAAYLSSAQSRSTFVSSIPIDSVEHLVTLVTCSYEYDDARYILLGSLVPIDKMNERATAQQDAPMID